MSAKPMIFVSAVSKELKSARQLVANTLTFLGYEPVLQDLFGTEQGDLREMLRRKIDPCAGLIQLAGQRFGYCATDPGTDKHAVSYTQFELRYAQECGKKVWPILLAADFPVDVANDEKEPRPTLQKAYRQHLELAKEVYQSAANLTVLENLVLKLRQPLEELCEEWILERRRVRRFRLLVVTALLLLLLLGTLVRKDASESKSSNIRTEKKVDELKPILEKFVHRISTENTNGGREDEDVRRTLVFTELEKEYGLPAGTLAPRLPDFAKRLAADSKATTYERAQGAYAAREYAEAERLALVAATEAKKVIPLNKSKIIEALELAGWSASERREDVKALAHFTNAAALTDKMGNPLEWGRVHHGLAYALHNRGEYAENEAVLRQVGPVLIKILGPHHPNTLKSWYNLANALVKQGKLPEAAIQHRTVLAIREKVLGAEHPDTLKSRSSVANLLTEQGNLPQSEVEHREVLEVSTRILGPEHPQTLTIRNNLAIVFSKQGKHADAEAEYRATIKIQERVLGPEHADTLSTRNNLAALLSEQGKNVEAEREQRLLLTLRGRLLDPDHPELLRARHNLANTLDNQGKFAEAEVEHKEVLKIREREFGPEHPETLLSRTHLAHTLIMQYKYRDAEKEYRTLVRLQEHALGAEDPQTLMSRMNVANTLYGQGKYVKAEEEHRIVLEVKQRVLGPEHPDTLMSRMNVALALDAQDNHLASVVEHRAVLKIKERVLGPEHPDTLVSRMNLSLPLLALGKYAEAEDEYRVVLKIRERVNGPDHSLTLISYFALAQCLATQGKLEDSSQFVRRAIEGARKAWPPTDPNRKAIEALHEKLISKK